MQCTMVHRRRAKAGGLSLRSEQIAARTAHDSSQRLGSESQGTTKRIDHWMGVSHSDVQAHLDVAAGGVGVRADLVGSSDQFIGGGLFEARQADVEFYFQAETTRDLADADLAGDRSVCWQGQFLLAGDEFQRTDEAGRVAGSEQLFRVGRCAALTAQFARGGQFYVEDAVGGNGAAVTASGGGGGSGVEGLDGLHGDISGLSLRFKYLRAK